MSQLAEDRAPGVSDDPPPEPAGRVPLALRLVLALAVLAVSLVGSAPRLGTTVDSGEYLAVAEGLRSGHGLTMPYLSPDEPYPRAARELKQRVDLTQFPPAYPVAVAAIDVVAPGGVVDAARWVSALSFAVVALSVTALCRRRTTAVVATAGLLSVDFVTVHSMAWSEPLLLAATAAAVAFAVRYAERRRPADLGLLCASLALASGARFLGTAAGLAIAVVLAMRPTRARRAALLVAASGVLPTVLWFLRNTLVLGTPSEKTVVWHPPERPDFEEGLENLATWTRTTEAGPEAALLLLPAVVLLVLATRADADSRVRMRIGLVGAGLYLSCFLAARSLIDANVPIDLRLLAPAHLFLIVALVAAFDVAADRGRQPFTFVAVATAAVLGATAVVGIGWAVDFSGSEASGHAAERWQTSQTMAFVESLPDDTTVVTNAPDAVWLSTGHEALLFIPMRTSLYTGEPNRDHGAQLEALAEAVESSPGAVVAFFDRPTRGSARRMPDRVVEALRLELADDLADGDVYRPRPS